MRILQVYHIYPAIFGGVSRVVCDITKELCKRGHEVSVLTTDLYSSDTNAIEIENNNGVEIYRVPTFLKTFARTNNIALPQPSLIYLVKNNIKNFDAIHFHGHRSFQKVVVHHYARKYHIPYIIQAHGDLPKIMAKRRSKQVYDVLFGYRLLRDASKVIALSRVEAEQYRGMGVPEEKIEVIPNGIDLSEYGALPPKGRFKNKFGIDEDEKIVLYLGRIHKSKGLDLLAEAFSIVAKELKNVRLVVIGPDDGYAMAFSRVISNLGIEEKVLLTGFVGKWLKLAAFVDSNVFVTPRFSGFPVTFLEACLAGCPIVTASSELDWIHDNVGYVVQNLPVALAAVISNILQDEQVYRRLRNNCKQSIKHFDTSTIVSRLENAYKSVAR